jgi:deoxyuridine 5'-triphosphate nucleotidohydrolase
LNPIKILNCSFCNNKVEIYQSNRIKHKNVFCNKQCEGEFKKSSPNVKCVVCNKNFHLKPSQIKKNKIGISCSRKCSGILKKSYYMNNKNPNYKHDKNLDFIFNLTNDGAYILGLIWADGSLVKDTITITQKNWEEAPLKEISEMFFNKNLVRKEKDKLKLCINSKELIDYLISLGGINRGKKSQNVEIPNIPEDKIWSFLCGYFDGDGHFRYDYKYPSIGIVSNSTKILEQISKIWNIKYSGGKRIEAYGMKALEICGKMYESCNLHNKRKYNYYLDILNWMPGVDNAGRWIGYEHGKYKRLDERAKTPEKNRVTDSGYDVYAIEFVPINEKEEVYMADMKLAIQPPPGFYYELVGRSSLPINNLHFLGGVGIIDRTYVGSIKMIVQKIDKDIPLPETPFKCGQLILRKFYHVEFIESNKLEETDRNDGGFGSTGKM